MKKFFVRLLLPALLSLKLSAQSVSNCKCRYPFKAECSDYCIEKLIPNDKFKETMKAARIHDSTLSKLQNWAQNNRGQSLSSILTRREMTRLEGALQTYYEDPSNNEKYTSRFMHGIGATISVLFGKDGLNDFSLAQTNFCFFPRINITQTDNTSFSIGAPVGIGVGIASNTLGGDAGVAFAYDLPLVFDYNFGCKSTRNAYKNFGGYVGAGFGYYHVSISQSAFSDFAGTTYGPMGRAGIRFSKDHWNGKGVTVGVFYKKGLEEQKLQTIGFNVLADF